MCKIEARKGQVCFGRGSGEQRCNVLERKELRPIPM